VRREIFFVSDKGDPMSAYRGQLPIADGARQRGRSQKGGETFKNSDIDPVAAKDYDCEMGVHTERFERLAI